MIFCRSSLYLIILSLSISSYSFADIIYSDVGSGGSGEWNNASTWDLPRDPDDGDTIIIKANEEVTITNNIVARNDVLVIVRGTLTFSGLGGGLWLNSGSVVAVESGGTIESSGFWVDFINIGGGGAEWVGQADGDVTGPAYASEDVSPTDPAEGEGVLPPGYSTVLPIELLSFETTVEGDLVSIFWASATETNNDFYTIERSTDAETWEIIGETNGAGTSKKQINYSFTDYNPIPGITYYRLKQTDFDGQFEYFDPSVILYEPENLFKVFPNPATDILQINTSSDLSNAKILVKDVNGQVVNVDSYGSRHQVNLYVSNLQRGVYIVELVFPQSIVSKRILKE